MSAVDALPAENIKPVAIRTRRAAPIAASAPRNLEKELAAAEALKFQLGEIFGEGETDTELLRDAIEGQTELLETVDVVLRQIAADQSHIEGIAAHQKTVAGRKSRLEKRVETMRAMLASALEIMEERKLERPLAVLPLKAIAPAVVVTDEAAIPARFWETPEPKLAKAKLADELKDHAQTLAGKLAEIAEALASGAIDADQAEQNREAVTAAFPTIPGAELDGGGATVQIRFS